MDAARAGDETRSVRDARIDGLRAEASEAVGSSANTLRAVRQRYRVAYAEELDRWQSLRDELETFDRARRDHVPPKDGPDERDRALLGTVAATPPHTATDQSRARALSAEVEAIGRELGSEQTELARLEIALRNLESIWLFLERGDTSLVADAGTLAGEAQMRIVEAQESERTRLAQEVHDGPAQVLSNAIFQVEYIERLIDRDAPAARTELRVLGDVLRRELGSVRTFISQLRPPILDELGLDGAITDAIDRMAALTGLQITTRLGASPERLTPTQQTVALRVLQEALQNVRKHGAATTVTVTTTIEADDWVLSVRDDGRGFDVAAVAARGRRNFGLQFMRERAELINARFEVHSRLDGGTLVRLAIPMGEEETSP